jgi:hypothetical protein
MNLSDKIKQSSVTNSNNILVQISEFNPIDKIKYFLMEEPTADNTLERIENYFRSWYVEYVENLEEKQNEFFMMKQLFDKSAVNSLVHQMFRVHFLNYKIDKFNKRLE